MLTLFGLLLAPLAIGWNLIGGSGGAKPSDYARQYPCVTEIASFYISGSWEMYFPGHPEASDMPDTPMGALNGYWVYCQG